MRFLTKGRILSVGDQKEHNGFKNCLVRISTALVVDPETGAPIREPELFDCEVRLNQPGMYESLKKHEKEQNTLLLYCELRSFVFSDKKTNDSRLGRSLILSLWTDTKG